MSCCNFANDSVILETASRALTLNRIYTHQTNFTFNKQQKENLFALGSTETSVGLTHVNDEHKHGDVGSSCLPAAGSIRSAAAEGSDTEGSSIPFLHLNPEQPEQHRLMWVTCTHT